MSARCLITLVVATLVLTLAAPGCGKSEESPAEGSPSAGGGGKEAPPRALGKPDLTVTPAEWHAAFKKDPEAARARYKDKVVEMSGTVDGVGPDPYGEVGRLYLEVPNFQHVECMLADKKPWLKVSPGSKVKVRGKLWERGTGVLNPCEIVEAGPNPAVTISAPELARQFAADRKEARKKYHDQWAYVKGEVAKKDAEKFQVQLTLKGAGDITVRCIFGDAYKKGTEGVKVGSRVDIFGKLSVFDGPQDREVTMGLCTVTAVK